MLVLAADGEPHEPDTSKHEDSWVRDFIGRFARAVRNIGGDAASVGDWSGSYPDPGVVMRSLPDIFAM
jgi:hypothetical protein